MTYRKVIFAAPLLLALSACAGFELESARDVTPTGSAFDRGLYDGYIELSSAEFAEGDYEDSDYFALRAKNAAAGKRIEPASLANRQLSAGHRAELADARRQLMEAFDLGAIEKAPAQAARSQVMFDCWVQEQEENFQPRDIAACRDAYLVEVEQLRVVMTPKAEPAPKPAPVAQPAPQPVPERYLVFFDFDETSLGQTARRLIDDAARNAQRGVVNQIALVGHADKSGPVRYNENLSLQRAQAVKAALAARGFPADRISVEAKGEADPLVPTADGVREPQNRRVEIMLK